MAYYFDEPSHTFNEYLLVPGYSSTECRAENVSLKTPLVKFKKGEEPALSLNIPLVSAIMQAVSDDNMAIALAKEGGISFIYGSQSIENQAAMVRRVKNYKAGFVPSDSNLSPESTLADVLKLKEKTGHSTMAVTEDGTANGKLLGVVTGRDYRVSRLSMDTKVETFMTPYEKLICATLGTSLKECNDMIWDNKLNALPVIDQDQRLHYFVFRKDYENRKKNPNELLDDNKRYLVGAGINTRDYETRVPALVDAGADVLCIDSSEGFTEWQKITIEWIRKNYGDTVKVGAVRPSATDNTTYVTTMLNEGSKFTYIPATLGNNEYLDASILLKKNAQNVVSIYFTSGKPGASEYHKYLTKTTDAVASANEVDPTLPVNQWVVSDFDGKYNFTFTNRADESETVTLRLTKGGAEGGYKVVKVAGSDFITTKDENGLSVKFLPIATTRTDGYLTLTDAQIKEGIKLAFTGKTNVAGELTFYATEVKNTSTSHKELLPSLDGDAKMLVPVANVNDKKQFTIQHEYSYACLNDKGEVVEGKKDTLFIPTYNFITVVDKDNADNNYYLDATRGTEAVKTNAGLFTFAKNIAGTYSLATVSGTDFNAVKVALYWTVEAGTGEVDMVFKTYTNFTTPDYVNQYFANVKILSGAELNMSLPAQQGHFTFDNERGSISMTDIKGINEGALASEGMVFWLDSVDTDAEMPAFYISRGIEGNETARMYMYNTIDSAKVFDEASANYKYNDVYFYGEDAQKGKNPELKVGFAAATEEAGKDLADQFKFNITLKDAAVADEYILSSVKKISLPNASIDDKQVYVAQKNGVVILTAEKENAMAFTLNKAEAPTSNESVVASEVKVVANNGSVVVKNAAGKNVVVSTILGQVVANEVLTSDNATINVPA